MINTLFTLGFLRESNLKRAISRLASVVIVALLLTSTAATFVYLQGRPFNQQSPSSSSSLSSQSSGSTLTSATSSSASSTTPAAPAPHTIGVRMVNGKGQFYDTRTGAEFVPRGNNYDRLGYEGVCGEPDFYYFVTFAPGLYNSTAVQTAFEQMSSEGYNVVRIFLSKACLAQPDGGLSPSYLLNVANVLTLARDNGIYVIFTMDDPPCPGYECSIPPSPNIEGYNRMLLAPGGVTEETAFWHDFITGLMADGAPLQNVFSYELRNEAYFRSDQAPLDLPSGLITTENGKTYDMSNATDKQLMMDQNLVYWIDNIRAGILKVDPTALVSIGFFVPQGPNLARIGDNKVIRTKWAIADPANGGSTADFIDLHAYPGLPGSSLTLKQLVQNFEIGNSTKPIIMGEFGASGDDFSDPSVVAVTLQNWQVESCNYGFSGWLLWTWDTREQLGTYFWTAIDGNGVIDRYLSPANRPNPCQPGSLFTLSVGTRSGGSLQVEGALASQEGTPIAGQQASYNIIPVSGPGVYAAYTVTGTVPDGATHADVGFRINSECGCAGVSNITLYGAAYTEGSNSTNRVSNPFFSGGLSPWGAWGNGTFSLDPSDRGSGLMLSAAATADETASINSADFAVTAGENFTLTIYARVSPQSVGSGYFSLVFLSPTLEVHRVKLPFQPGPVQSGVVTTDLNGDFQLNLSGLPPGTLLLEVAYAGDSTYLSANTNQYI